MQYARIGRSWINAKITLVYISSIFLILQAAVFASLLDAAIIRHQPLRSLIPQVAGLIVIMIVRAIMSWPQEILGFKAGAKVRTQVRQQFLKALNHIGPIRLTSEQSGGSATIFIEQIEALQNFYAEYLPQMQLAILIPLTIVLFVFSVDWLTGLILLITAPLIPLFMALIGMGVESANQRHFKSLARLSGDFLDRLRGLVTLKLFNQSKVQAKKIAKAAEDYREKTMSVLRVAFLSSGALELFSSVAIAIVAVVLGLTLLDKITIGYFHELTLGKAVFILLLAPEYFLPLRQLGVHYHARAEAIAAATELMRFSSISLESDVVLNQKPLISADCFDIDIQSIGFTYPGKDKLFKRFTLAIKPGEKIAIVGKSGAGKTTLIRLLMGFLQPTEGAIFINQQNLQTVDISQWQQQIAFLGQTPQLFPGSIKDNVLLAKPDASDAKILQALEKAGAMPFIQTLSAGLNTVLAEQNFGVSGGQAQRIALARVFLSDRPIIILDEPTASLDKETEQQIIQAINTYLANKTIILISHRVETVGIASRIIKLEKYK